jgi:hypothetical protein
MSKVIGWVMLNGATLLGCLQALIKAIKELLTGVVNLASLFVSAEKAEAAVKVVRAAINKVDAVIENIKSFLVK